MVKRLVYIIAPDPESRLQCSAELVKKISHAGGESIVTSNKTSLEKTIGSFMDLEKINVAIIREHEVNSGSCSEEKINELKGENSSVVLLKTSVGPDNELSKELNDFLVGNDINFSWVNKDDLFYWEWPDRIIEQDPLIVNGF